MDNEMAAELEEKKIKSFLFKTRIISSIILILGGLACFLIMYLNITDHTRKANEYIETNGFITYYDTNDDGLRAIVVTYEVDGEKYDLHSKDFVQKPQDIGNVVSIKYNPNDPSDAIWTYESIDIKFILIGIVLFLSGLFSFIGAILHHSKRIVTEEVKEEEVKEEPKITTNRNIASLNQQVLGTLNIPNNNDQNNNV